MLRLMLVPVIGVCVAVAVYNAIAVYRTRMNRKRRVVKYLQVLIPKKVLGYLTEILREAGGQLTVGKTKIRSGSGLIALAISLAFIFAMAGWFSGLFGEGRVLATGIGVIFGLCLPLVLVKRQTTDRRRRIMVELPGLLEIIALSMETGMTFDSAIDYIVKHRKGDARDAFARAKAAIETGMKRELAYTRIAAAAVPELKVLISAIQQSERQGRPSHETIQSVAAAFREKQISEIETSANRLPTTMLLPIFVFFVPPIILLYLLPALTNFTVITR